MLTRRQILNNTSIAMRKSFHLVISESPLQVFIVIKIDFTYFSHQSRSSIAVPSVFNAKLLPIINTVPSEIRSNSIYNSNV
jgi:hypothetical protein